MCFDLTALVANAILFFSIRDAEDEFEMITKDASEFTNPIIQQLNLVPKS